jgi:hypothetical protein
MTHFAARSWRTPPFLVAHLLTSRLLFLMFSNNDASGCVLGLFDALRSVFSSVGGSAETNDWLSPCRRTASSESKRMVTMQYQRSPLMWVWVGPSPMPTKERLGSEADITTRASMSNAKRFSKVKPWPGCYTQRMYRRLSCYRLLMQNVQSVSTAPFS